MTSYKSCDICGKEVNLKRIRIFCNGTSFSWVCGVCYRKLIAKKVKE